MKVSAPMYEVLINVVTCFVTALTAPGTLIWFLPAAALINLLAGDQALQIKGANTK
jgi:hypothetical protein